MKVIYTVSELRKTLSEYRKANPDGTVGFAPTMGALHAGHAGLMQQSVESCDFTVASIFVNPAQFNDATDFEKYPVKTEDDLALCEKEKVDLVFMPSREEMYPEGFEDITLSMETYTKNLCGQGRPGHFEGVLLIVSRLFNLVQPDIAFFGKKDYQQYVVIRRMAELLNFPVEVRGCDTKREESGLAMSSRNLRMDERSREHAELINRALRLGQKTFEERNRISPPELCEIVSDVISSGSQNRVEYVQIVDLKYLQELESFEGVDGFLIAVGVFCGSIRLIDNIEVFRAESEDL